MLERGPSCCPSFLVGKLATQYLQFSSIVMIQRTEVQGQTEASSYPGPPRRPLGVWDVYRSTLTGGVLRASHLNNGSDIKRPLRVQPKEAKPCRSNAKCP